MILNHKSEEPLEIKIGEKQITQVPSSKLLGVQINDKENWKNQINEKGGVISSLNQRLYLIRRLKNQVNKERLRKITDSIWTSKLRYGLQLYGQTRIESEDVLTKEFENLQKAQNNLLRTLECVRIKDKRSIGKMLESQNMLSVNQLQAQVKLTEMWKAHNSTNYPIKLDKMKPTNETRVTRSVTSENFIEPKSKLTFIGDATRLWNKAPMTIRQAKSIGIVKKEIKKFVKNLPI